MHAVGLILAGIFGLEELSLMTQQLTQSEVEEHLMETMEASHIRVCHNSDCLTVGNEIGHKVSHYSSYAGTMCIRI